MNYPYAHCFVRYEAIDFLYPMGKETYAIFISNPDQEAVR